MSSWTVADNSVFLKDPVVCFFLTLHFLAAALMSDVYEDHKDDDGFLYIAYSGENTFGC